MILRKLTVSRCQEHALLIGSRTLIKMATSREAAACRRNWCQVLHAEGVVWPEQRVLTAVNLGFLNRGTYIFIQAAPQLSS
jgi:hypothetical protein